MSSRNDLLCLKNQLATNLEFISIICSRKKVMLLRCRERNHFSSRSRFCNAVGFVCVREYLRVERWARKIKRTISQRKMIHEIIRGRMDMTVGTPQSSPDCSTQSKATKGSRKGLIYAISLSATRRVERVSEKI